MRKIADIILTENSTTGNQSKTLAAQTVEITHEADTVSQGADGHISRGRHPSKIFWFGGTAKDLANITNVKIVGNNDEVSVDGELCTTFDVPHETADGVGFSVLRPD